MALALRRESVDRVPRRTAEARPTAERPAATRLTVVPRRRRAAGFVVTLSILIAGLMLGAAVLHTQLAERQLHIDDLNRSVVAAEDRFDVLRRQRAELRSPSRLATEAQRLGMTPATVTEFVEVDPHTVMAAIAATGQPARGGVRFEHHEPLDQFLLVKRVTNEAP